jgi:hypothetical protein
MILLYTTTDRSFAELIFLTFQREEIPIHSSDSDPATSGLGSPFMQRQFRVYLLDNDDLPRARELLAEIGADKPDSPVELPGKKATIAIVVGTVALVLAVALGQ